MDVALDRSDLHFYGDMSTRIYTEDTYSLPHYLGKQASIKSSICNQGAIVLGNVNSSVISNEVLIEEDAVVDRCVVMEGSVIKRGAKLCNVIVAPYTVVETGVEVNIGQKEIALVGGKVAENAGIMGVLGDAADTGIVFHGAQDSRLREAFHLG